MLVLRVGLLGSRETPATPVVFCSPIFCPILPTLALLNFSSLLETQAGHLTPF